MKALVVLNRWLMIASGVGLTVIILLTVIDVLSANLRGRPITGVYDVVGTALVYVVFLGIPEVFRTQQNITVDVIDHFISRQAVLALGKIAQVATLAFLLVLEYAMIQPARDAIRFDDHKPDSGIPFWVLWLPILFGICMATVVTILALRKRDVGPNAVDAAP
jgi:TRAP-type C4-dicarboxylate transport system permease small subunit